MNDIRNIKNAKPNAEESKQSWSNMDIWDNEKKHERNAE